jgi:putative ABC transport system permease protein
MLRLWITGLLLRRRGRMLATSVGIAVAVALLSTIGLFLTSSKATMTDRASASVATDWQVEVQPGGDPVAVEQRMATFPGLSNITIVNFAQVPGLQNTRVGATQVTGAAVILGMATEYQSRFPDALRSLAGSSSGVLLAQQTASNLGAKVGDTVVIGRANLPSVTVRIDGIVDFQSADSFFQKVGAPPQSQPKAAPDNVVILPPSMWHFYFDPVAKVRPDLLTTQIHAHFGQSLPTDPSAAYTKVVGAGHNLELALVGSGLVGNNLGAQLAKARSDALYAQVLFLFLSLPGALIAALLTWSVANTGASRRRRDQALLRARGASTKILVAFGLAEALVVAVLGSIFGIGLTLLLCRLFFGSATLGVSGVSLAVWLAIAIVVGLAIASVSIALPAYRDARDITVANARRSLSRTVDFKWLRWYPDLIALSLSLLSFWFTSRNGFKLVFAVEGVANVSVNYWSFAGPALAWIGGTFLILRISSLVLTRGRRFLERAVRPIGGGLSSAIAASMSRQRRVLDRSLIAVALTVAFALSTSIFNATYQRQAEFDAVLSNGAMVTVVESAGSSAQAIQATGFAKVRGVRSATPLLHRFAYVGKDLQDLYGIDAKTVARGAKLQDSYFSGGSTAQILKRMGARPDALLVSLETVKDFQLNIGDRVLLRLQNAASKEFRAIPFTYVGVAKKFPSAPSDSFLVANADYISTMTGSSAVGTFLIDTAPSDSTRVAQDIRAIVGTSALVKDIASKRAKIGKSITSVELKGLTKVELTFALLLVIAATGLLLWLGISERRRMFAIVSALGARRRQVAGFVWSETIYIASLGLLLGGLFGLGIVEMVVKILTGVFDPPPTSLSVPWLYLVEVLVSALIAIGVAMTLAFRRVDKPVTSALRDF